MSYFGLASLIANGNNLLVVAQIVGEQPLVWPLMPVHCLCQTLDRTLGPSSESWHKKAKTRNDYHPKIYKSRRYAEQKIKLAITDILHTLTISGVVKIGRDFNR